MKTDGIGVFRAAVKEKEETIGETAGNKSRRG